MASIALKLLYNKQRKDNTFPLALRVIKDRKARHIFIGHNIDEKYWDERLARVKNSYPNSSRLNSLISKKIAEAEAALLDVELQSIELTPAQLKNVIKGTNRNSFFKKAEEYIELLNLTGKYVRAIADASRIKRFKKFLIEENIGDDIKFESITEPILRKFMGWLKLRYNNNERTIMNFMVMIRTIYNQAIRDGLVSQKFYPFGRFGLKIKFPETLKIGLSEEELKKMEEIKLEEGSYEEHVRNVWLFSFYFAGMRVSDVLQMKWSDFKDGRLYYTMGKNNKSDSLPVPDKALKILKKYETEKNNLNDLVFPELKILNGGSGSFEIQKKISNADHRLNELLKEIAKKASITKNLTMHIARHTFGNISGDKIPVQLLQKLYRHSDISTTINYQKHFIHKEKDDALNAVVNF